MGDVMNPLKSTSECEVCRSLFQMFHGLSEPRKISLGSFEEAVSTDCQGHKTLINHFVSHCRSGKLDISRTSEDVGFIGMGRGVQIAQSVSNLGFSWDLLLAKRDVPGHGGEGVVLNPDWVNLDMVKEWKSQCLAAHGARCENPLKVERAAPPWLVDVQRRCVVPGSEIDSFVALSYRTGDNRRPNMHIQMLTALREPGALDQSSIKDRLPPMFYHAMYLTSALKEGYLWVDALCMESSDDAIRQTGDTGLIFATATIVIIVADGTAEDGISGLKGAELSQPRSLEQKAFQLGQEKVLVRNTGIFSMKGGTPYYECGQTFQEHMMAKRKLLFNHKEVHWECQCNQWHEELTMDAKLYTYIEPRLREILAGFPNLSSLGNIIANYGNLKNRTAEDALPGIMGLLSVLSRSFTGGFLFGIPEMFFDRALGWAPHWAHVDLERIESSNLQETKVSPMLLPSWSWVGWRGLVDIGQEAARVNHREHTIEETIPVTRWYTGSSATTPPAGRRLIRSSWYENRKIWKDTSKQLPVGWTQVKISTEESPFRGEPRLWPDGCGGSVYKHKNLPEDDWGPTDTWFYPFPVPDIQESTPLSMPEQTPYLFCRTTKASVWARRTGDYNRLSLHDSFGSQIGSLHLHNKDQLDRFPKTSYGDEPGSIVQLVLISRSRIYSKTWKEAESRYGNPCTTVEHNRVLWVEWEGNMAHRRASGTVTKEHWEELELEDVELVLA